MPPELHDGQSSTVYDCVGDGLNQALRTWGAAADPGDTLELKLVEYTEAEFEALPDV